MWAPGYSPSGFDQKSELLIGELMALVLRGEATKTILLNNYRHIKMRNGKGFLNKKPFLQ